MPRAYQQDMKFYYSHNETCWREQDRFPSRSENGLRELGGTTGLVLCGAWRRWGRGGGLEEGAAPAEACAVLTSCWHQGRRHVGLLIDMKASAVINPNCCQTSPHGLWFYDGQRESQWLLPFLKVKAFSLDPTSPHPFLLFPLVPTFSSPSLTIVSAPNALSSSYSLKASAIRFPPPLLGNRSCQCDHSLA